MGSRQAFDRTPTISSLSDHSCSYQDDGSAQCGEGQSTPAINPAAFIVVDDTAHRSVGLMQEPALAALHRGGGADPAFRSPFVTQTAVSGLLICHCVSLPSAVW